MGHDKRNGNNLWGDASILEFTYVNDYDIFTDKGHHTKVNSPSGYKNITVHFVFDATRDLRHKARLGADGHLTQIPVD
jgi:hypothetical protein